MVVVLISSSSSLGAITVMLFVCPVCVSMGSTSLAFSSLCLSKDLHGIFNLCLETCVCVHEGEAYTDMYTHTEEFWIFSQCSAVPQTTVPFPIQTVISFRSQGVFLLLYWACVQVHSVLVKCLWEKWLGTKEPKPFLSYYFAGNDKTAFVQQT